MSDVSRETLLSLEEFQHLLIKWNKSINLISKREIDHVWSRHIEDSMQVYNIAAKYSGSGHWVDIGSGGGLPAIVSAIMDVSAGKFEFSLIESDGRKCAFLRQCVATFGLQAKVHTNRIEQASVAVSNLVTARALAPLDKLLEFAGQLSGGQGCYIFPKGKNWATELRDAKEKWCFDEVAIPSETDRTAAIIVIDGGSCERR